MENIQWLKDNDLIIYEVITGSTVYGTNAPDSDIDVKGVFILPLEYHLRDKYISKISDERNDSNYYEIGEYIRLLKKNDPNALEILFTPDDFILYNNGLLSEILENTDKILSKVCRNSFGKYGESQIKKAKGENKRYNNPVSKDIKTPLDFCYIIGGNREKNGIYSLAKWLKDNNLDQSEFGLTNMSNARDVYSLYGPNPEYRGIVKIKDGEILSNEIRLSSIPKGIEPLHYISYNKDGYTKWCKDYKNYWNWVEHRNEERYKSFELIGEGYDSKNMMHCFRLLTISSEIPLLKKIKVRRDSDVDMLMSIRNGLHKYDDLIKEVEKIKSNLDHIYDNSDLIEMPDHKFLDEQLYNIRNKFYGRK